MDDFENMTEFSPFTWQPVYSDGSRGEIMDFSIAIDGQSSSRGVLETIVEETSDDETENGLYSGKWSGSDSFSSASSETGSVVHVETQIEHDNQDTMSERDFICPPKRRRQEVEQPRLDFIPTSSLFSQLLNVPNSMHADSGLFDSYFMKPNDLRYRFDELGVELFPNDSDRLSYTSLSRSSSLIQFESLERQLQNDSQISGSSPSVYSYEGVAAVTATHQDLSEKSAPIAIALPTIKISSSSSQPPLPPPPTSATVQFTNSDSEPYSSGSTSGSFSSDDSEILATVKKTSGDTAAAAASSISPSDGKATSNSRSKEFRAKNSVDSLSEDSGYCDRDIRSLAPNSLSLPSGNDLEDEEGNAIEEKSIVTQMRALPQTLARLRSHSDDDDDICYHSMESLAAKMPRRVHELKIEEPSAERAHERATTAKNKKESEASEQRREHFASISSPELYASGDTSRACSRIKFRRRTFGRTRRRGGSESEHFSVASLPDLRDLRRESEFEPDTSVASRNFNLFDFGGGGGKREGGAGAGGGAAVASKKVVDISASCANLTLLNYSDDCCYDSHRLSRVNGRQARMSGKFPQPHHSEEEEDDDEDDYIANFRSKELTSLLEEISAHFNKNLSILNDREASYEPQTEVRDGGSAVEVKTQAPPRAPPRARTQIKTSPNHAAKPLQTFDRDPTNLATTYAQSLEKCNFNVDEPVNVYSSRQNIADGDTADTQPKPVHKRNFVSSTPNLNYFDFEMRHVQHYSSIDNAGAALSGSGDHLSPVFHTGTGAAVDENRCTSMKEIPSAHSRASSTGILASHSTGGSRSGLSVSFCPIVSEISWQVSHDDDDEDDGDAYSDDVDMDPSAGASYDSSRSDSLVNYYPHDAHDDEEEDFDDFRAVGTSTAMTAAPTQTHVTDDDDRATPTPPCDATLARNIGETFTQAQSETFGNGAEQKAKASSHKMLVETQTPSEKFIRGESAVASQTMAATTVPPNYNYVNERPLKPAKQKKSIFSRLSSGFRFSFRGKKNKKLVSDGVVHYPVVETNNNNNKQAQQSRDAAARPSEAAASVRIPLKSSDEVDNNLRHFNSQNAKLASELHEKLQLPPATVSDAPQQSASESREGRQGDQRQSRPMKPARESPPKSGAQVMGKPPLPKQPPRIVGTTSKRPSAHPPRASSTPREYEDGELNHRLQQQHNTVGDGLRQQYYAERARTMDAGHKIGLIETNLDTDETRINGKTQSLMELGIGQSRGDVVARLAGMGGVKVMNQTMGNIEGGEAGASGGSGGHRPHKSMEFLLDKENHHRILPPENELQKARESNLTLSEHQLRVQASLQKLNIPDWYKQYSATGHNATAYVKNPDVSGILRKRNSDIGRWQGLSSKTTSLSSLGSNRSDRSPVMLSPSAHSHHGGQTGFSRWSTSHLNSSQTSPSVSARSSFVRNTAYASTMSGQSNVSSTSQTSEIRNSFRKPYLGWRSQEKLNQPRTAHERLASSLMSQKQVDAHHQQQQQQPIATPEIQSSIKEVTSAIVHYVNDQTNRGSRSRSVSPSTRCWLESSFVGTKPLESPQTPAMEGQFASTAHKTVNIGPMSVTATNYETIRLNGIGGGESSVI